MNQSNTRRGFLKTASLGTLAAVSIPQIVSAAMAAEPKGKKVTIEKGDIILFQGDSITDSGRNKTNNTPNLASPLGNGYALMAAGELLLKHPDKDLKIFNKGISGNKVYQLAERWDADALDIKPTVLSIHIGVNDFWHTLTSGYKGTIETYIADYKKLLDRTKAALPGVKLILCEPFAVMGVRSVDEKWYPTFNLFRQAARDMADQYNAPFVPYQAAFDKAIKQAPPIYWTGDGVHPSVAGAALMAQTWLEAVK
ncbi:GDSL-type esterase/lipase family protein [Mucilaginibacter calamicampi]|uniref:GDSL-type esterase/lipase family protein n=1 Tax=Mucilaginibacter calamicampi TaxID=1302352 RepID=A0ABW2YVF7_9SPHI